MFKKVAVIVLSLCGVYGRYTSYSPTTKTYDLQVPGSRPIRIIEAEPPWDRSIRDATTEKYINDLEHRRIYDDFEAATTMKTKTTINNPVDQSEQTTEDTAKALKNFLNKYAEKVRRKQQIESEENLETVRLISKDEDEARNKLATIFLDENDNENENEREMQPEKPKSWDLMQIEKHNHPYDDKRGWVTLEAVPWSVSKISKWQHNANQQNPDDWEEDDEYHRPPWSQKHKPSFEYASHNGYAKPIPQDEPNFAYKPNHKPAFNRPSTYYAQKVEVQQHHDQGYSGDFPKPTYVKKPSSTYPNNKHHQHTDNCRHTPEGEIITDGLPANFPKHQEASNRRRGTNTDFLPPTHPFSGDGEWVLLTTTKGYKYPKRTGERAMQIAHDSVGAHRTVRLTVLPPLKDSNVNMTTSHGGLLQVESTFQTVEQSQKAYQKKQKLKMRPITTKRPLRNQKQMVKPTQATVQNNGPDTTSVLAAVGAGMIPATMAMLVPMMNGRKKRDIRFVTVNPGIEITLPRYF